jgi:hypothetical protein
MGGGVLGVIVGLSIFEEIVGLPNETIGDDEGPVKWTRLGEDVVDCVVA